MIEKYTTFYKVLYRNGYNTPEKLAAVLTLIFLTGFLKNAFYKKSMSYLGFNVREMHAVLSLCKSALEAKLLGTSTSNAPSNVQVIQSLFFIKKPVCPPFSYSKLILLPFIKPRNLGKPQQRYYSDLTKAPTKIREFIETHQIPNPEYRSKLRGQFNNQFGKTASILAQNGLLILPQYINPQQLAGIKQYYKQQIESVGNYNSFLRQTMFSGSSHKGLILDEAMSQFLADPYLLALISDFAGADVKLSDFRGYTTQRREDISFRAWKWHHDGAREPERKVMILLNDVLPGGGEMWFMKETERWWRGHKQRDSFFSMEEVLSIAAENKSEMEHGITRCYGKAGTVILFTGQCLHRGTRSEKQSREVLVFTYKRDVPDAALYPIPPIASSVTEEVRGTFVGKSLRLDACDPGDLWRAKDITHINNQSNQAILVTTEQDTSIEETQHLQEVYSTTATLSSSKLRFWSRPYLANAPFVAIVTAFRIDVHHETDLAVHDSDEDVDRDVLRIRLREYPNHSPAMKRLNVRCRSLNLSRYSPLPDIPDLQALLVCICNLKMKHPNNALLNPVMQLAKDLSDSLIHCDENQDLRTQLTFIYLLYDYVCEELNIQDKQVSERTLMKILTAYAHIVMIDDHELHHTQQYG